ncbi:MAG: hypothetical protein J6S57_02800 [Alphaproteobacteria bacterium]|nr:hypothetical protein [Alphaproteobacteria bacterium]
MKHNMLFSAFMLFVAPTFAFGACSIANLTHCLDSACAINIGSNPAARCQYCGSTAAGTPKKSVVMKNISAGSSMRYNISDKDLKKAPTDPGERYVWATRICLTKVLGCTADDVTDNYDSLIEKSCTAAGISIQMTNLTKNAIKEKTQTECTREIEACIANDKHCGADYKRCKSDAEFDNHFSDCVVYVKGCDSFSKTIRSKLIATRDSFIKNANTILETIVETYQSSRKDKLTQAQSDCRDLSAKNRCIKTRCDENMPHKCDNGYDYEKGLATQLCAFYDIACNQMK